MNGDRLKLLNMGLCPECGSTRIYVTSTDRPYRRFKCKVCDHRWKTIELIVQSQNFSKLTDLLSAFVSLL